MNDESIHDLAAAYALDAVDESERAAFEEHLAGCAECRASVAELGDTAALLAATTQIEPPAALREQTLARVAGTSRQTEQPAPGIPEGGRRRESETVSDLSSARHRRSRSRSSQWLAAAGAAAAVVVGTVVAWQQPWADQLSGRPTVQLSATQQVLTADDAERFVEQVDGATVTVVRSAGLDQAVIVTEAMPPPPQDRVYQLWYFDEQGQPVGAGLMPEDADDGQNTVLLEGQAATAQGAGVTVEPEGGSEQPTSEPVVAIDFG